MIRTGVVVETDLAAERCRVQTGGIYTDWLQWLTHRAGRSRSDGDRHQFSIADRGAYTGITAKWLHTKDPKPQKQKVALKRKPKEQYLRALQHPKAKPVTKKKR